ncbi:MAG: hypothetical protein IKR21_06630, partial [Oscillospiraceae bacterium]|nr:hypothetical protein [Oscillospiraceae bacterium]
AIRFDGNDTSAAYNADFCLFMERYEAEREKLETYWIDQESFDSWFERELAYYADTRLENRAVETLSDAERIQRRNELDRKRMEEMKKAAEENGGNNRS